MSNSLSLLEGKRILIVDDEHDVLESLVDLLSVCETVTADNYESARALLESERFDIAVLDIMGVDGYDLLEIAVKNDITALMLTARAVTPEDVQKSFQEGAAYFLPKEEMINIETFLADVLEAKQKGKSTWGRWFERLADFCERKFGKDWQDREKDFWERFPFH